MDHTATLTSFEDLLDQIFPQRLKREQLPKHVWSVFSKIPKALAEDVDGIMSLLATSQISLENGDPTQQVLKNLHHELKKRLAQLKLKGTVASGERNHAVLALFHHINFLNQDIQQYLASL